MFAYLLLATKHLCLIENFILTHTLTKQIFYAPKNEAGRDSPGGDGNLLGEMHEVSVGLSCFQVPDFVLARLECSTDKNGCLCTRVPLSRKIIPATYNFRNCFFSVLYPCH